MAIKVNGTTVIDDSRNLVNIVSGAGSSTTAGAVGTYTWGRPANNTNYGFGDTASSVYPAGEARGSNNPYVHSGGSFQASVSGSALSGTWRCMSIAANYSAAGYFGLWVRIS